MLDGVVVVLIKWFKDFWELIQHAVNLPREEAVLSGSSCYRTSSEPLTGWRLGLHITFMASGVLFAEKDYIADNRKILIDKPLAAHD